MIRSFTQRGRVDVTNYFYSKDPEWRLVDLRRNPHPVLNRSSKDLSDFKVLCWRLKDHRHLTLSSPHLLDHRPTSRPPRSTVEDNVPSPETPGVFGGRATSGCLGVVGETEEDRISTEFSCGLCSPCPPFLPSQENAPPPSVRRPEKGFRGGRGWELLGPWDHGPATPMWVCVWGSGPSRDSPPSVPQSPAPLLSSWVPSPPRP